LGLIREITFRLPDGQIINLKATRFCWHLTKTFLVSMSYILSCVFNWLIPNAYYWNVNRA
jgi:hypothetical protein